MAVLNVVKLKDAWFKEIIMVGCGGMKKKAIGGKIKMKAGGSFPDLNKDGKVTKADILMGRGVGDENKKMAYGGKVKKMAYGGKVKKMKNGGKIDGCAMRGKTKGRMV